MTNSRLRIAVVQISCHPAARIGGKDYLSEPFVGFRQKSPLMELGKVGLPVAAQRQKFRTAYLKWSRKRLAAILERLKLGFIFHPRDARIPPQKSHIRDVWPDVVVFPEYSIPFDHLDLVRDFARETGVTVFAGTHSLESDLSKYGPKPKCKEGSEPKTQPTNPKDLRGFNFFDFGLLDDDYGNENHQPREKNDQDKYGYTRIAEYAKGSIATKSVMPVFNVYIGADKKRAIDILIPKRMLSIFEMTASGTAADSSHFADGTAPGSADSAERAAFLPFPTVCVRPLREPYWKKKEGLDKAVHYSFENDERSALKDYCGLADSRHRVEENEEIRVLPLICSEALQFPIAHADKDFDLAVFLAYNDKSEPFDPEIQRHSKNKIPVVFCNDGKCGGSSVTIPFDERIDFWWTDVPNRGRLPEGDCVVVTDVDMKNVAVPVNINKVEDRFQVLALSAVVPENDSLSEYRVATRLAHLCHLATRSVSENKCGVGDANPGGRLTVEYALRVLEECRDAESPTPLQLRKVLRLCDLKDVDKRLWEIHGQDIIFDELSDKRRREPTDEEPTAGAGGLTGPLAGEKRSNRETSQLGNLNGLQRRQARECIEFIRALEKSERLNADQAAVLHQAHSYCRTIAESAVRERELKSAEHVERAVWRYFDGLRERAVRKAVRQVTAIVADLVTRFGASSAWLFRTDSLKDTVRDPEHDVHSVRRWLRLVITHNARFDPERLSYGDYADEQSFVGYVAKIGRGALYREIVHSYRHTIPRNFSPVRGRYTASAIAVPIFALDRQSTENELLGVLTLESNRTAAFAPHHLAELESEASRLAHSLILLRKASETARDYRLIWNPEASSWNLTDVLNEFCFNLASSVPDPRQDPGFGCTVWYADHENYKAFAQGAVRFDHEYLTSMLPTVDAIELQKGIIKPQSFVGYVTSHEGTRDWVFRDEWDAAPYFVRKDKAVQMGLRTTIAAPIYKMGDADDQPRQEPIPADGLDPLARMQGWPQGALSFYFYDDDGASREAAPNLIDDLAVLRCSDILCRFLSRSRSLGAEMAAALARSRLRTEVTRLESGFEVLRQIVMDCLDGDGCSVFLCDNSVLRPNTWPTRLYCVSTTGVRVGASDHSLESSATSRVDFPYSVFYDIRDSEEELRRKNRDKIKFMGERTLACLLFDVGSVRDNLTNIGQPPDEQEKEQRSPARHIEAGLLDAFEDRRFLGVGVFATAEGSKPIPLGVIRVIRSAHGRPYVKGDVEVLQAIARTAVPLFLDSLHQFESLFARTAVAPLDTVDAASKEPSVHPDRDRPCEGTRPKWLRVLLPTEKCDKDKHARDNAVEGLRRVCSIPEFNYGWTHKRVRAVLRDLLVGLRPYGTRSAFVSIVTENDAGSDQMDACYFESLGQDHPAFPPQAEPVLKADDAIRWRAHNERRLIQFDRGAFPDLFTPLTDAQGKTAAGFCLPLQLGFHGRPVNAVLAVDFNKRLTDCWANSSEVMTAIVYCINQAAVKLVALSAGVTGVTAAAAAHAGSFTGLVMGWLGECLSSSTLASQFTFVTAGLCDKSKFHRYFDVLKKKGKRNADDRHLILSTGWSPALEIGEWPKSSGHALDYSEWCRRFSERMIDKSHSLHSLYSRLVDRNPKHSVWNPDRGAPIRRTFGRSPHECADNIRLLEHLDVKLDYFVAPNAQKPAFARFALPLRFGFYILGYCIGEFNLTEVERLAWERMLRVDQTSDQDTEPIKGLLTQRECVNVMSESIFALNEAWLQRAYSIAYIQSPASDIEDLFGIDFVPGRKLFVPGQKTGGKGVPFTFEWPSIDERQMPQDAATQKGRKRKSPRPKSR